MEKGKWEREKEKEERREMEKGKWERGKRKWEKEKGKKDKGASAFPDMFFTFVPVPCREENESALFLLEPSQRVTVKQKRGLRFRGSEEDVNV